MSKHSQGTREQRLLVGIHEALDTLAKGKAELAPGRRVRPVPKNKDLKALLPQAERLPMMIQRHGPAQTVMFLENKDNHEDNALLYVFHAALNQAEPTLAARLPRPGSRALEAYMEPNTLTQRLHLTGCCVELANLLMRSLKVIVASDAKASGVGSPQ